MHDRPTRADHRHHRPGRLLPRRAAAREGLRGARHGAPLVDRDLPAARATSATTITLHTGDLLDQRSLVDVLREREPDEIYNLAAMSFVAASWNQPVLTAEFTGIGRHADARGDARGHARGALLPGLLVGDVRQGARGAAARDDARSTRARPTAWPRPTATSSRSTTASRYDLFACSGILFNHEGERRGLEFVTRKVTHARGRDQARPPGRAGARQPRRRARLGLREGLRRGHVADAPAGRARRLRDRDRRGAQRPRARRGRLRARRARPRQARSHRPALPAPRRGRASDRRRLEGPREARLGAADELRGDGPADGRRGPRAARPAGCRRSRPAELAGAPVAARLRRRRRAASSASPWRASSARAGRTGASPCSSATAEVGHRADRRQQRRHPRGHLLQARLAQGTALRDRRARALLLLRAALDPARALRQADRRASRGRAGTARRARAARP